MEGHQSSPVDMNNVEDGADRVERVAAETWAGGHASAHTHAESDHEAQGSS